ncbi:amidase [Sphingomonas sp. CFBP 13714]|uniref:amidase n=1 Tax=Sphingomonas sp. CFBP 13714 TaxID=2775308 RepID=UPI00177BC402|nr:amidase [Sphingomonas sp. CFBP 13714]MBD8699216.1 amidase [Sphingomonas sp. CFBP 13714]
MRHIITGILLATAAMPMAAAARTVAVEERSIEQLQASMTAGTASSVDLVRAYLARIAAMDRKGPTLRSMIALNPDALAQAKALDAERRAGRVRGPLHGVPVLIKDNVETADAMPTTAGSLALKDNMTRRDAPVVAHLRAAGAVILGKTNLSEWANIRSTRSMSGWSAVGGLVRNPYALDRTACGSSSGSGAAIAASFAAAAIGTETDGSVVCPSSINGLVGLKPTIGLVSRTHVVPISHSQDTPGPMARSVRDVATMFSAMIAADPADAATAGAGAYKRDYAAALSTSALSGLRIGVVRPEMTADVAARYEVALGVLKAAGAVLVEVKQPKLDGIGEAELLVLQTELKADLDTYLATTPAAVRTRTLDQVIAFNRANAATEMPFFAQETFEAAAKTKGLDDPAYKAARAKSLRLAGAEGIDAMLKTARATVLVEPTYGPAWLSEPVYGDQYGGPSASELPAVAGYPNLTVPMGLVRGLPVGLSFIATRYGDGTVLNAGYAYEQLANARTAPRYLPSAAVGTGLDGAR